VNINKKDARLQNLAHIAFVIHVRLGCQKKTHTIAATTDSGKIKSGISVLICACKRSEIQPTKQEGSVAIQKNLRSIKK
jgi:hypothetical protein